MVRKWSYLVNSTPTITPLTLNESSSLYHFKVFRKTTRFKKFNRGITKMVRKNYARRKHRTNWLVLSYITKAWVSNYLNMRQFERFFNALTRFKINSFSADVSVFHVKLKDVSNKDGINIISCSNTPLKRYMNYSNGSSFLTNPIKNTNNVLVQTLSAANLAESSEVYPNLILLESHTYSYDDLTTVSPSDISLGNQANQNTLSITSSIYSTLVLLTLFNVNRC
jgi:hypothetical protein